MATPVTDSQGRRHYRRGWIYVLMITLVMINYMDRTALSVVAKTIAGEFKLSPVEMGYLFSSFLWSYVIFLLPIGIILARFTSRPINPSALARWLLAIAPPASA